MPNPTWHEQLPGDLQGHESLAGFENLGDFANGYLSANKELTDLRGERDTLKGELDTRVKIPGEGATDEERAVFRKALGVPEQAGEYGLTRPEEIPEDVYDPGFLMEVAHKVGIPKSMVAGLHEQLVSHFTGRIAKVKEDSEKFMQEQVDALKKDWGQDFEKNAELARRAFSAFGGEEEYKFFESLGFANDPRVLRMFHTIGTKLAEDSAMSGGTGGKGELSEEEKAKKMFDKTYSRQ